MFFLSLYSCLKCCNLVPNSPTFETAMVVSLQQIKLLASWEDPLIWLWAGAMHHFCLANSRKRSNGFGPQRSWQNWPSIKKSSSQQNRAKIRRATHSLTILGHPRYFQGFAYSYPSHHIKEFCLSNLSFQYIINEPIQVDSNLGFCPFSGCLVTQCDTWMCFCNIRNMCPH